MLSSYLLAAGPYALFGLTCLVWEGVRAGYYSPGYNQGQEGETVSPRVWP